MIPKFIIGSCFLFALSGCTQESVLNEAAQQAIDFSGFANKSTKAPIVDLTVQERNFGICAYKITSSNVVVPVFDKAKASYSTGKWTTDPIRYWDLMSSYEFYAFAPHEELNYLVNFYQSEKKFTIGGFLVNETIEKQKDILFSSPVATAVGNKQTVAFDFFHIMTKVNLSFAKASDLSIRLISCVLKNVPTKGNCEITFSGQSTRPTAVWSPTENKKTDFAAVLNSGNGIELTKDFKPVLSDLLLIPHTLSNISVDIVYSLNGERYERNIPLNNPTIWSPQQNLIYNFTINSDITGGIIDVGVGSLGSWENITPKNSL